MRCPEEGGLAFCYDHTEVLTWRHLNVFQHRCEITCRLPRGKCRQCGRVFRVRPPWEGLSTHFTKEFEAFALLLMRETVPPPTLSPCFTLPQANFACHNSNSTENSGEPPALAHRDDYLWLRQVNERNGPLLCLSVMTKFLFCVLAPDPISFFRYSNDGN